MTNRAAIRWVTKGNSSPPMVQYMLIDNQLEYIISPKECAADNLKVAIRTLVDELIATSGDTSLEIYYKTINVHYGKHRKDSEKFHRFLKRYLAKKKLLQANHRLAFLLKKSS